MASDASPPPRAVVDSDACIATDKAVNKQRALENVLVALGLVFVITIYMAARGLEGWWAPAVMGVATALLAVAVIAGRIWPNGRSAGRGRGAPHSRRR